MATSAAAATPASGGATGGGNTASESGSLAQQSKFNSYGCDQCHGANGEGTDDAPDLISTKKNADQISAFLQKPDSDARLKGMPNIEASSPDLQPLIAYVLSLKQIKIGPVRAALTFTAAKEPAGAARRQQDEGSCVATGSIGSVLTGEGHQCRASRRAIAPPPATRNSRPRKFSARRRRGNKQSAAASARTPGSKSTTRIETFGIGEPARIAMRNPLTHHHARSLGNAVSANLNILRGKPRHQPCWRIEPQRFAHHGLGVGQPRQVFQRRRPGAKYTIEFRVQRFLCFGILCQQIAGPRQRECCGFVARRGAA